MSASHHRKAAGADDLATLIVRAEALCLRLGLRFTAMRRRVLETLAAAARPLGAYELAEAMREKGRTSPVSIYRTLEFLEEAGLVHRLSIRPAYVVCSHDHHHGEATVFLVCSACGLVDEVASAAVATDLATVSAEAGFRPERRAVEIEGRCSTCQAA